MDLKSMLNDSSAQKPPRLHTPQSSYDARTDQTPSTEHGSARPTPYAPPLQPVDSRAQSGGSYFAIQSPYQNNSASASTPSAGTHSAYTQSPGGYPQSFTPRENAPPSNLQHHNAPYVSPSPSSHQPPTPGALQHQNYNQNTPYGHPVQTPGYSQYQSPVAPTANGLPGSHGRQMSPNNQIHNSPATPLGPPTTHMKASPQAQRPTSQGQDQHFRRTSYSSIGSAHSKDYNQSGLHPELARRDSVHQPYISEIRERERSVSISPKTIPKPSPYRESSMGSQTGAHARPSALSQQEMNATTPTHVLDRKHESPQPPTSSSSLNTSIEQKPYQGAQPSRPSPANSNVASQTPRQQHEQLPVQTMSPAEAQTNLKRDASYLSDGPTQAQMPRKRMRRNEIPIWARSARQKPLRLGRGGSTTQNTAPPPTQQRPQVQAPPVTNGHSTPNQTLEASGIPEPSIANIFPYEDLTRQVCDWIVQTIGFAEPPPGGAAFEIEAKIGEIVDINTLERVDLPIKSESIFNREKSSRLGRRTKFESSMNQQQHKALNDYLNGLVRDVMIERQQGSQRHEIYYAHPKENDEFYELSEEGMRHLPPHMHKYAAAEANRHHRKSLRIRRTINKNTGRMEAQIVKTRIADMDILNPQSDFDYRISISIESPWEGEDSWLIPSSEGGAGRNKDRMSYRHMMYQIDLTQVSYNDKPDLEHELEVEIATEQIRKELESLRNGQPAKYEDMIRGLIDNVRLLCRKGTVTKPIS